MNPKFAMEEIKKIRVNNKKDTESISVCQTEGNEPMSTRLNKVKGNSSNIFHSDVRIINKKLTKI